MTKLSDEWCLTQFGCIIHLPCQSGLCAETSKSKQYCGHCKTDLPDEINKKAAFIMSDSPWIKR